MRAGTGSFGRKGLYIVPARFVVAWTVAAVEDSELAKDLLEQAMGGHGVPDVAHADRGTSMTSKPVAQLLVDLGVTRSHSRPHVSNDNPYSEAAFKTLTDTPVFPKNFGSLPDARAFADAFFGYCNPTSTILRGLQAVARRCESGLHASRASLLLGCRARGTRRCPAVIRRYRAGTRGNGRPSAVVRRHVHHTRRARRRLEHAPGGQ